MQTIPIYWKGRGKADAFCSNCARSKGWRRNRRCWRNNKDASWCPTTVACCGALRL